MKNFRINLIIRVILLTLSIFLLLLLFYETNLIATFAVLLILIIYQVYSLIKKVDTTNKELTRFLESIKHSDFSRSFPESSLGDSFKDLNNSFNEVIKEFRRTRKEKEESFRYLQTVMQHVGVGLISYNSTGKVEFINNAAKRILRVTQLNNIQSLNKVEKGVGDMFLSLKSGDKKTFRILQDDLVQLIVYAAEFKLKDQRYILTSIQNIQSELEETEMEAWQKLIRVLTHEIMNSVTPISSLASTVLKLLESCTPLRDNKEEEVYKDMGSALSTIQKRSEGLLHFVDNYRSLTKIPKPNFDFFPVKNLFERVDRLFAVELKEKGIDLSYKVEPDSLEITADPELIEQVLINLVLNSIQALQNKEGGKILLEARPDERGKSIIRVKDNGPGIAEEIQDRIFVPFFTTKREGSGIGLSLSRQIIRSHGGNIRIYSKPDIETVFTIRL
jgi:two-component system, NtrC family, nitrogen regulation sensor histidine kinase NtrY